MGSKASLDWCEKKKKPLPGYDPWTKDTWPCQTGWVQPLSIAACLATIYNINVLSVLTI